MVTRLAVKTKGDGAVRGFAKRIREEHGMFGKQLWPLSPERETPVE